MPSNLAPPVMTILFRRPLLGLGLALLAGALSSLAMAPLSLWPLQTAALALLFYLVLRSPAPPHAARIGLAYGSGAGIGGIYWLYISMHTYGEMAAPLAALAVLLMGLTLGVFPALTLGAAAWLRRRWHSGDALTLLAILPPAWALSEWLRGWVLTGFPWISSGYAHTASPLGGYAPLLGVYGVGLLAALLAALLTLCFILARSQRNRVRWCLTAAIALLGAGVVLGLVAWTTPVGRPLTVRLLQGNVGQDTKFEHIDASLALYDAMLRSGPADLIATPETAVPTFPSRLPLNYLAGLSDYARQSGSALLLGMPIDDSNVVYTNSAIGFSASGGKPYRYDKHHLVPFGEATPTGLHWFVALMAIPLGDFARGALVQAPFEVKDQRILPNICYEDLFGEEIADQLAASHAAGKADASILLNMSNLAWFGASTAIPQHLQISQMRTLETGRPMLRATNTGATAIIDSAGHIHAQLPPNQAGILAGSVQGMQGVTPYILLGNSSMLSLCGLLLALAWIVSRRAQRSARPAGGTGADHEGGDGGKDSADNHAKNTHNDA